MTVVNSVTGRVQPGRYEDFLSQGLEVSKLYERHGANNVRLFGAVAAGEASTTWAFSAEFDNMEGYGQFLDELNADMETQALLTRIRSADSPVIIEQQSLASEVPLGRKPKAGRGNVVEVHISRVNPGRFDTVIALSKSACSFVEKHGARNAKLYQLGYAGMGSGSLMLSWEYPNLATFGRAGDAWNTDPKGQSIGAQMYSTESASTLVFSGVYLAIPL